MEILSNFGSVYCFISFIYGAVFMLMAICIVAMGKEKEPKNKVRFFRKHGGLMTREEINEVIKVMSAYVNEENSISER